MKQEMSSVDVAAVVLELQDLIDAKLNKAYQHTRDELRLKIYVFGQGYTDLAIESGGRIHLTKYPRPAPKIPPSFPMFLRKNLMGGRIECVKQYGFDRIVEIKIKRGETVHLLLIELFSRGNVILLDSDGTIILPLKHMTFRDRRIKKGEKYITPPPNINPLEIDKDELKEAFERSKSDAVRTMATYLNLGGLYAEELCLRAEIDKKTASKSISEEELKLIYEKLIELFDPIRKGNLKPHIVMEGDEDIDVLPFELEVYKDHKKRHFNSFNEALDEFFSKKAIFEIKSVEKKVTEDKKTSLEKRLENQLSTIKGFEKEEKECIEKAEAIYENYSVIEEILQSINDARQKKYSWAEIKSIIEDGKDKSDLARMIKKIDESKGLIEIDLFGTLVEIYISSKIPKNAERYYERAKALKGKLKGAKIALEHTKDLLEKTDSKDFIMPDSIPQRRVRIKEHWYSRFRWFKTSDGFLVVGGRDADTNEELVKKYMVKDDIFFHTQAHGAPVVIVKTEGEKPSEEGLREVATFAVSYSNVWKAGQFEGDCYFVQPEQVSKTPESGEYIEKGSFIIRGKRNYFKKIQTEACIGIEIAEETRALGGPPSAVKKIAKYFLEIEPGEKDQNELSKEVSKYFFEVCENEDKRVIKEVASSDKIAKLLPPGKSRIKK